MAKAKKQESKEKAKETTVFDLAKSRKELYDKAYDNSELVDTCKDVVMLIEARYGNPNGDPAMEGMPRVNSATGEGLISPMSIKRKIRDYVAYVYDEPVYVQSGSVLNANDREIAKRAGLNVNGNGKIEIGDADKKLAPDLVHITACKTYWDVRTFGAVATHFSEAKVASGRIYGAFQLGMGVSVDPVEPITLGLTRCCVTTDKDSEDGNSGTMGSRSVVPYGLYVVSGRLLVQNAQKNGFTKHDFEILKEALAHAYENDMSSMRGEVNVRGLYIFDHEKKLGNAPQWKIRDLVKVRKLTDAPATRFEDYSVEIGEMPNGVTMEQVA